MKRLLILAMGLSLLGGTVSTVFGQDTTTSTTKKTKKTKKKKNTTKSTSQLH